MAHMMTFTVEHEVERTFSLVEDGKPVLDAAGEPVVETEYDYVKREYEVPVGWDPGQNGGWDDPSWSAYAYLDGDIVATDGLPFDLTEEVEKAAEYAVSVLEGDDY